MDRPPPPPPPDALDVDTVLRVAAGALRLVADDAAALADDLLRLADDRRTTKPGAVAALGQIGRALGVATSAVVFLEDEA